jgi:phage antirepressor protein
MQSIQVFNNPAFGNIRVAGTEANPQFCLTDVCKALKLSAKGVNQRLGDEVISNYPITDKLGREQQALFVNEDGLYDVILDSRKTEARQFRKWITSEVLPTIRKHGAYMTDDALQKAIQNPDFLIQLATELKNEKQKRLVAEKKIQETRPQVIFADAVTASSDSILVGELAKLIKQNGVDTGQRRLFKWLRANGYLCKKTGECFNEPTQYSMELGLFEIKKTVIQKPDGSAIISKTVKVTGKGQVYFVNKFLSGINNA